MNIEMTVEDMKFFREVLRLYRDFTDDERAEMWYHYFCKRLCIESE